MNGRSGGRTQGLEVMSLLLAYQPSSPSLNSIRQPDKAIHYKNLAGALLGYPLRIPSLYSATYATALAPKGYTLDGLTCIISDETFLNIQALLAGPYRFTQP